MSSIPSVTLHYHMSSIPSVTLNYNINIIIMEICKAPILRLKALNKHSNEHRDGNVISNKKEKANT